MLARGVLTFAFFGTDAFVPLAIQNVRDESVTYTGIVLTRLDALVDGARRGCSSTTSTGSARASSSGSGSRCIAFGIVGVAALLSPSVPVWTVAVTWSIGAAGMGSAYSPLSLVMLDAAEPGREGAASAALQLSDQLGLRARAPGSRGAAVALGEVVGWVESDSLLRGGGHHRQRRRSPASSSPNGSRPGCARRPARRPSSRQSTPPG